MDKGHHNQDKDHSKVGRAVVQSDDQSVSNSTASSKATAWLDERIAEQRKGFNGTTTATASTVTPTGETSPTVVSTDQEVKQRARISALKSGNYREPVMKRAVAADGTGRAIGKEDNNGTTTPPRKPNRANSKVLANYSVQSTPNKFDKDVLHTMPKSSPKASTYAKSPTYDTKSNDRHSYENNKEKQLEEDLDAKRRAKVSPPTMKVSKRSTASKAASPSGIVSKRLNQMEEDMAAKSRARTSPSSAVTVTKRLNQMGEDMAAKARFRTSPSNSTTTSKNLNQAEMDAAAKNRAKASPSSCSASKRMTVNEMENGAAAKDRARARPFNVISKRTNPIEAVVVAKARASPSSPLFKGLNQMEADTITKSQGRVTPTIASTKRLNQMEADLVAKAQSRATHNKEEGKETIHPGAVSSTSSPDLEERIAYKTRIYLSGNDQADETFQPSREPGANKNSIKQVVSAKDASPDKDIFLRPETARTTTVANENALQSLHQGSRSVVDYHNDYHLDIDGFMEDDDHGSNYEGNRLAVATAVKEYEDEDVFIPAAVEYDPDAKPPIYKNRRFRMYGILGCILLILLAGCAIGILAIQKQQQLDSVSIQDIPTDAPTCERCSLGIEEKLELEVGLDKLNDASTAEFQAKDWILYEDPRQLGPTDPNLIQRFLLATFYFETHKLGDWASCNRQDEDDPDETCSFLEVVGIFPLEYEGVPGIRWLSSFHECDWSGVFCDELNQTKAIELRGQDLQGTFPEIVTKLPYLQTLHFPWNKFGGPLPTSLGSMKHLLNIELQYNEFTGTIPWATWSNAKNLQLINFAYNMLTGQLDKDVATLRNVKGLYLYDNMFSGVFPKELSQVSLLTYARLQRNDFSGTIDPSFGDLKIIELWLHGNPVTGTIPSELGKLSNYLLDLRLYNTKLHGEIPAEIWGLTKLWRLELHETLEFSGTISRDIGNLQSLSIFKIHDNKFTGTVPTELASLPNLHTVTLGGNQFFGSVPSGLCELKGEDGLSFLEADCLPHPDSTSTQIFCECCDSCCNAAFEECSGGSDEH